MGYLRQGSGVEKDQSEVGRGKGEKEGIKGDRF